jgi:transcriptional regulator with XRE-family HTH domain
MQLTSDAPLAKELSDPEVREHTVESQIKIGIPFQMRAMREHRGWTQETLADKLGTTQNTISRLENPKTGKPSVKTLLRIARAFDVGLLVRFVPFGFYGDVIDAMDATHVEVPSYAEEVKDELATLAAIRERHQRAIAAGTLIPLSAGSVHLTSSDAPVPTVTREPLRKPVQVQAITPNNALRQI